ncbi:aldo/keto reductase [Rhodococcus sp. NCIMB 12038]|uniref:aldo/keto reductase n=1 Tax=Rhodococcus sp. NCIMB 12038 TaxID=933800 RepID=UPI000B3C4564|nr:aldo/keto reductase [Rhodococcus sp. NCIMB 12038]OUS91337.1 aldo/keto reductase [Rhodococcus sp. NCIMB 12038]
MKIRTLGQGLEVSAIGLGCMALTTQNYGSVDEAESIRTLHSALDRGITLLDTAETYGQDHANERLLGRGLKGRREQAVIATKFGLKFDPSDTSLVVDGNPKGIRKALEGSLRRLETEYIDIYFQHRLDPNVPVEEVWAVLADLVQEGKVRHLGLSEPDLDSLRKAHAIHPVTVVENEYSLFTRTPEGFILPALEELGIGMMCYAPIGRGFLTGAITSPEDFAEGDFRSSLPRFQGENFYRNLELVDRIRAAAQARGATPAQLALAWLLARGPSLVPIPGMEKVSFLEENLGALDLDLSEAEIESMDSGISQGAFGERYPESFSRYSGKK